MWRSALTCRSVRRAAGLARKRPRDAAYCSAGKRPRRQRGATRRRRRRVAQCAFARSVQTTPTSRRMMLLVALCSLRLIMCGILNALLIGRWPGRVPSCKCTGRKLISMPKKRRPVAKLPPYLKAILWPLRSEGPVIACEGKPVKPRLGRRGVRARDRARRDADVTLYPWRHALS
jgi:hypothetical protein